MFGVARGSLLSISVLGLAFMAGCQGRDDRQAPPYDLEFEIPRTETFAEELSAYGLFDGPMADLQPAEGATLYELSSELFTDYAYKQRLLRVPAGTLITVGLDGDLQYPEGTVLVKTFFYPKDMRDPDGPRRIIETRLLVKTEGVWNVATYRWNADHTEAFLVLEGAEEQVSWIDEQGAEKSTQYVVPHEGECVTCHQRDDASAYIGPTLRNLNRLVVREGAQVEQLAYLEAAGLLEAVDLPSAPAIPNYKDTNLSLDTRARAYLDINCAHCHNPQGWSAANEREFDFRFETPLGETGLMFEEGKLRRALETGEMPYLGTTLVHDEGIDLLVEYLDSI